MILRTLLFISLSISLTAQARMYQWVDEDTGTTQFSGKPPTWYRSNEEGPRIFVFDGGRIVDDTGIQVSEEHRELLRRRAYNLVDAEEQAREEAILALTSKKLEEKEAEEKRKEEEAKANEEKLAAAQEAFEKQEEIVDANEELNELLNDIQDRELEDLSADELQELVQEWEALQERVAREIISQ